MAIIRLQSYRWWLECVDFNQRHKLQSVTLCLVFCRRNKTFMNNRPCVLIIFSSASDRFEAFNEDGRMIDHEQADGRQTLLFRLARCYDIVDRMSRIGRTIADKIERKG